ADQKNVSLIQDAGCPILFALFAKRMGSHELIEFLRQPRAAHNPRIVSPNFSTLAGPIPSISSSCFGFAGRACATAVKVRSCITTYAGTLRRFASAARHSFSRAATASPTVES